MNESVASPGATVGAGGQVKLGQRPGSILRGAREAQGLSQSEVAHVIRFSARQIDALERDDYSSLPGTTVVRGFIRGYAKLLRLDPEPLLASLDPVMPVAEADVRAPTNIGAAEPLDLGARLPLRYFVVVLAAFGLLLAGFWHFSSPSDRVAAGPAVTVDSAAGVAATPVLAPVPVAFGDAASVAVSESAVSPPVAPAVGLVSSGPAAISAVSAPSPTPPPVGLRLEFDARSWIEIRDAGQRVIFSGEYAGGTRQNIDGKGPFHLWVGRASGVRVFLGDRAIDLRPHTREDVARLTVE